MSDDYLLEIEGLFAWYISSKMVLCDFNLQVKSNEIVGIIGLNGAGKSTLMNFISGLLKGYSYNRLEFHSQEIENRDEKFKRKRYTVFAEDMSFQYFTFLEYISYVFHSYGKELPDLTDLIQGFNFENYQHTYIKDLSTGNRKKVYLITAFALKTELLLLDEPVNGLDFQSTEFLYKLMNEYREYGTIIFSSHILESICMTSDRVLVLEDGCITKKFDKEQIDMKLIREALNFGENL